MPRYLNSEQVEYAAKLLNRLLDLDPEAVTALFQSEIEIAVDDQAHEWLHLIEHESATGLMVLGLINTLLAAPEAMKNDCVQILIGRNGQIEAFAPRSHEAPG